MFDYKELLGVLGHFKKMSPKKRRKIMTSLLYDEDFIKWLFQPEKIPNLTEIVTEMYHMFASTPVLQSLLDAINYEGCDAFNRNVATFLTTVCNITIEYNNEQLKEIEHDRKDHSISSRDARDRVDDIQENNTLVAKLLKRIRKINKRNVNILSRTSRLPKYITNAAFSSVPEPKYVDRYKIGFYLNNLLNTIYSDVEENGDFDRNPDWKEFFTEIFGKFNLAEAATFILLEGVHRLDKYNNSRDVRSCWDSLTDFALETLEKSPESLRQQMIELYIKRVAKMFTNNSFDLRVDLLDVVNFGCFPKLANTVSRYADKILELFKKPKSA